MKELSKYDISTVAGGNPAVIGGLVAGAMWGVFTSKIYYDSIIADLKEQYYQVSTSLQVYKAVFGELPSHNVGPNTTVR